MQRKRLHPWSSGLTLFLLILIYACNMKHQSANMEAEKKLDRFAKERQRMVEQQIRGRGIRDTKILDAMRTVPRHEFVPERYRDMAYNDSPLPIGHGQTISQPFIVAYMTEKLQLAPTDTVLEIGTGSGYQAAVLSEIVAYVYTIEIIPQLGTRARETLKRLGYENVEVKIGDGYDGWPEHAPFNAIIMTAAPLQIPDPLLQQLKIGGRLIAPVGDEFQELVLVTRTESGFMRKRLLPVRFVPMTGEAQKKKE